MFGRNTLGELRNGQKNRSKEAQLRFNLKYSYLKKEHAIFRRLLNFLGQRLPVRLSRGLTTHWTLVLPKHGIAQEDTEKWACSCLLKACPVSFQ